MNEALKAKWLWRFAKEEDALWRKAVIMKYRVDSLGPLGWWCKKNSYAHRIGYWKSIIGGLDHFRSIVHFKAINGSKGFFLA